MVIPQLSLPIEFLRPRQRRAHEIRALREIEHPVPSHVLVERPLERLRVIRHPSPLAE